MYNLVIGGYYLEGFDGDLWLVTTDKHVKARSVSGCEMCWRVALPRSCCMEVHGGVGRI